MTYGYKTNQVQKCAGKDAEQRVYQILQKQYQNLEKTKDIYNEFDYTGHNEDSNPIYIELKSRTNKSDAYSTTMIGKNKVEAGFNKLRDNSNCKVLFFFLFTDGLFYYELVLNTYLHTQDLYGKSHCFIPASDLEKYDS